MSHFHGDHAKKMSHFVIVRDKKHPHCHKASAYGPKVQNWAASCYFGISTDGVKHHIMAIFKKLGATNRSEAVAIALRRQLLKN